MSKNSRVPQKGSTYIISQTMENWSHISNGKNKFNFIHRSNTPLMCIDLKEDKCVILQETIDAKIGNKKISLSRPNEISLSMNIANNSLKKSQLLRKSIIQKIGSDKSKSFFENDVSEIYDYLEEVQKTIVFSYKAIEAMCNSAIPDDYIYKKDSNKKGVLEFYDKLGIERWVSTTEKVSKILPDVYRCVSPTQKPFWGHFKKLEELRNDIIHSKSSSTSQVLSELLSSDIDKYVRSCEELLKFFFEQDRVNPLFPLIPGITEIVTAEMDDMEKYFEHVK
ncbi:hypothetical protein ACSIMU_001403 [Yersinia enterocolitica]|uniref:hypothetical protein n=2 Tax=Yersinia enterocolitica TaxID=630 RepID=UPI001CA4D35B|nr:hypothetical protein [Yersinia enterocolitica]EKN4018728.1 hypothetical protein [Yersinia enterocolitica]EKN5935829.1 hypothetical protein [Yersinia enterocolitica]MBW5861499.1 hypothetical protein [Yersinia enterocolitica]HDL7463881.1 hypothetical protein [Yersinia enterocolitica]HDL7940780.1 hypothetical protein [Yersinia enterocolitica]